MASNGQSPLPFRQAEPVWSQGAPTLSMPSVVTWSQPRPEHFSDCQVSKPLALEFERGGKEALLDEYVKGFRAAQGQIAQTIPQPQQPPLYAQTLSKDRVDDFAKNAVHPPSAFRRVLPRQGGPAPPGSGEHQQAAPQGPSAAELDRALDLSLDPAPRLSMLAARFEGQQQQAIMPQASKVDMSENTRASSIMGQANRASSELCFRGSHVEGLGSDWKRSAFEMLRVAPQKEAKLAVPQEGMREAISPGSQREERRISQQKSAEVVEKPMSSKWCGSLNAEAWPTPPKRKRAQEETIDMNELPALLRWMESLEGQGLRGHGGGGKDQVLECLEEMLGFRRKGGEREAVRKQDVSHLQEVAQVSQQGGIAREEIRTVPLGRRWEEECIRGVLETIIRQGAARRGGDRQRVQAGEESPHKRAKPSPRAFVGVKAEARHMDGFGSSSETFRTEEVDTPRSVNGDADASKHASNDADVSKPTSNNADVIMRAQLEDQLQRKEHALAASQHAMEALKQQMAHLHQGSNPAHRDGGANGHEQTSRNIAAESGEKASGADGFGLSPTTPQGEGEKLRSSLKEETELPAELPRPENRLEETS